MTQRRPLIGPSGAAHLPRSRLPRDAASALAQPIETGTDPAGFVAPAAFPLQERPLEGELTSETQ